jgi:hypothetical protein
MRRQVVGMLTTGIMVLSCQSAIAATTVKDDRTGDAPARIDATRARYTYGGGTVKVTARIPNLGNSGNAALSITRFDIFEAGYVVRIVKRQGQAPRVRLFYFNHFELEPRSCGDVNGQWNRQQSIRLAVSTACLDGHARRNIFVQFGIAKRRDVDRVPAVRNLRRD